MLLTTKFDIKRGMNLKYKFKKQILWILIIIFLIFSTLIIFDKNFGINVGLSNDLTEKEKEWLKQQGTLIYGADRNAPPLRFQDNADSQYKGVLIDYFNAMSVEIGTKIELHPMVWEEALESLAQGETDICDMFPSKEREKYYLFSKPIYNLRSVLAVKGDNEDIRGLGDLDGKVMALQKGDYASEFIEENYPNIIQYYVADLDGAISLLAEGKVDATLGDEPVMFHHLQKQLLQNKIKIIDKPVYEKQVVLAVPKSKPQLIPILNKGIDALHKKETMEKIQQKWFGISTPIVETLNREKLKGYFFMVGITFTSVFILMAAWSTSLKKQVNIRTKELEDSRNDLQIVFDGMTEYMIVLDGSGKIVNINRAFLDYLEKEKKQIMGRRWNECLETFSIVDFDNILDRTMKSGVHYQKEEQIKNSIYEINTYPLKDIEENIKSVLILMNDVTGEKISKRQILQSNKMVAIGELAAGIAHEIRNPLGIVRNHSFIMRGYSADNPLIGRSLEYIDSAIDRASRIIDNLLNFSRISGNTTELVDINLFINSIIELQSKYMQNKGITYEINCEKGYSFFTNQESLKHILINLISNAIDATPKGGKITIKAYSDNNEMIIECLDTGEGIDSKGMERIFNPFYTTKEPGKGTGLGLYITYNEVKKLKGDIEVESKIAAGTKFKIRIPSAKGGMLDERNY